jgi:hypothetical protein
MFFETCTITRPQLPAPSMLHFFKRFHPGRPGQRRRRRRFLRLIVSAMVMCDDNYDAQLFRCDVHMFGNIGHKQASAT